MNLDKKLVDTADFNSAVGMGSIISRTYTQNLSAIDDLLLSDEDKEEAKQTLFELTTEELQSYGNTYPCVSVVGPAQYNVKKGTKALDVRTAKGAAVRHFIMELATVDHKKRLKEKEKGLVKAFYDALTAKQKTFSYDGKDYTVKGRTRFIESKYVREAAK